jgi:hypothetical protein
MNSLVLPVSTGHLLVPLDYTQAPLCQ